MDQGAGRVDDRGVDATGSSANVAVAELEELVKTLLKAQAARAEKMEQEMAHQDQRWKSMQHQFQLLQGQVGGICEGSRSRAATPQPPVEGSFVAGMKEPKSHPLTKEDDVEHFLTTFERMAAMCQWPRGDMVHKVGALADWKSPQCFCSYKQ